MRRVKIVLGTDAEPLETGIKTCLFQQRGAVAGGVDDQAAVQFSIRQLDAADNAFIENRRRHPSGEADLCSRRDRSLGQKLECPADVENPQSWNRIIKGRGIVGRDKSDTWHRMVQSLGDSQSLHLIDKRSAAGANGGPNLVVLFQH